MGGLSCVPTLNSIKLFLPHVYPWCHACDKIYQALPLFSGKSLRLRKSAWVHHTYVVHNIHLYLLKWWVNPSLELCSGQCSRPHHSPVAAEVKAENGITLCATQNQHSALSFFLHAQHNIYALKLGPEADHTAILDYIPHSTCIVVGHCRTCTGYSVYHIHLHCSSLYHAACSLHLPALPSSYTFLSTSLPL